MPPAPIRRPLTITAWLFMSIACLVLSPLLLLVAAVAAAVMRKPQPLLLARLLVAYFARELAVLLACGALWVASGAGILIGTRRFQRLHYKLLRWFVHGLAARTLSLLAIEVQAEPSPQADAAMNRDRPLVFFSRHAGPADTLLIVDQLLTRYDRLPSVVFKDTLAIDPSVDLIGHRLPHAVLDTSDREECEARIRRVTRRLGVRGVLVLFPEGGNFTPERRSKSIRKLRRAGHHAQAAQGEQLTHVLLPRPSGALAALHGNPEADVVFAAHTGLGTAAFPRELWRKPPIGLTLRTRMWTVPASERPTDPDDQIEWLNAWWKRIDDWVDSEGTERPMAATESA